MRNDESTIGRFTDVNWFVIQVKRFREVLAASTLAVLGIEVFLPMVKVENPEQCVIKVASKPLFPSYFFARFRPESSLGQVEGATGVLQVIRFGSSLIPVDEQVVREIQQKVEADGLIRLQRRELKPGDPVSIERGPFAGMMGRVEWELDDRKRVAILLQTLGQLGHARVLIAKTCLDLQSA